MFGERLKSRTAPRNVLSLASIYVSEYGGNGQNSRGTGLTIAIARFQVCFLALFRDLFTKKSEA